MLNLFEQSALISHFFVQKQWLFKARVYCSSLLFDMIQTTFTVLTTERVTGVWRVNLSGQGPGIKP